MMNTLAILAYLTIASVYDIRTRKVPNWFWAIGMVVGLGLLAVNHPTPHWSALTINILTFAALFQRWNKGDFGGADVKAHMVIALMSYWTLVAPIGMIFALAVAYSRRNAVERTRFIPWMLIGTTGVLAVYAAGGTPL